MYKTKTRRYSVVDFAEQVVDMQNRIDDLEAEVQRLQWYEREWRKLSTETIRAGYANAGAVLTLLLDRTESGKAARADVLAVDVD